MYNGTMWSIINELHLTTNFKSSYHDKGFHFPERDSFLFVIFLSLESDRKLGATANDDKGRLSQMFSRR